MESPDLGGSDQTGNSGSVEAPAAPAEPAAPPAPPAARIREEHAGQGRSASPRGAAHSLLAAAAGDLPAHARVAAAEGAPAPGIRAMSPHSPRGPRSLPSRVRGRRRPPALSRGQAGAVVGPPSSVPRGPLPGGLFFVLNRDPAQGAVLRLSSPGRQEEPKRDTPAPAFGAGGNGPPGYPRRSGVLGRHRLTLLAATQALFSTPRAFSSHGLFGTWPNPA